MQLAYFGVHHVVAQCKVCVIDLALAGRKTLCWGGLHVGMLHTPSVLSVFRLKWVWDNQV